MSCRTLFAVSLASLLFAWSPLVVAFCGDTVTDVSEQCDDGNMTSGDGCSATCQIECDFVSSGLINGDFEFPGAAAGAVVFYDDIDVGGWTSTTSDKEIEFRGDGYDGYNSNTGVSHIELNGRRTGSIYQRFRTVPGMIIDWTVSHRSTKKNKTQDIEVLLGDGVTMQSQGVYSAGESAWVTHTGSYTVPQGQYRTRLEFLSQENGSKGNLLDSVNVTFAIDPFSDCPVNMPPPVHTSTGNGRLVVASNSVITCDPTDVDCADGQGFVSGTTRVQNSQYHMVWIDADADGTTFNSSSSTLSLAAGETVVWAGLYWMGGYTDFGRTFITAPPDPANKNTVAFKAPGGGYQAVTGTVQEVNGRFYRGYADVTGLMNGGGEYWVADIQASYGKWLFGGWSLVVVTENASEPERSFTVFDPFLYVDLRARFVLEDFAGLYDPAAGIEMAMVLYDGDTSGGDIMLLDGNQIVPEQPDSDFPSFKYDIGNSTIRNFGLNVTSRTPSYPNNFGYDSGRFDVSGMTTGSTDLELELVSNGDVILTGVFAFQTDIL